MGPHFICKSSNSETYLAKYFISSFKRFLPSNKIFCILRQQLSLLIHDVNFMSIFSKFLIHTRKPNSSITFRFDFTDSSYLKCIWKKNAPNNRGPIKRIGNFGYSSSIFMFDLSLAQKMRQKFCQQSLKERINYTFSLLCNFGNRRQLVNDVT